MCSCVSSVVQTIERSEKLIESLELPQEKLSEDQRQLRELLVKYSNVFPFVSDSELGCTDLAKHFIDPFKQQPYRTPAIYREKISQMVSDMK